MAALMTNAPSSDLQPRTLVLTVACLAAALLFASGGARAEEYCVTCAGPDQTYLCRIPIDPNAPRGTAGQLYCITELAKRGGHQSCKVRRQASQVCDGIEQVLAPGPAATGLPFASDSQTSPPPSTIATDDATIVGPAMTPALRDPDPAAMPPSQQNAFEPEQAPLPRDGEALTADETGGLPPPDTPPKTVEELAKRTLESSKENLDAAGEAVTETAKSAGDTVNDAAKKTGEQIGKVGSAVGNAAKKTWNCLSSFFSDC